MIPLPQRGGCVCGAVRFVLRDDPVTVYACHCTDCQTESGSTGLIAVVVHSAAVEYSGLEPEDCSVTLPDGRVKGGPRCPRCRTGIGGGSRGEGLMMLEAGTFDDTSWVEPAGHIWARSAQPWVAIPEGALRYDTHPGEGAWLDMTRAWKGRGS